MQVAITYISAGLAGKVFYTFPTVIGQINDTGRKYPAKHPVLSAFEQMA
jgi:hypothetical protein